MKERQWSDKSVGVKRTDTLFYHQLQGSSFQVGLLAPRHMLFYQDSRKPDTKAA
jgi:hypothetical protein